MIKTFREAVTLAMAEEMRRDDSVIVLGEDVGVFGGGFGATEGLLEEFGSGRVIDTPISETAFAGMAAGAAATGLRPVVEIMFSDFLTDCLDQIVNEAAKFHFMYAGRVNVPLVIRTAAGAGTGAGIQHSQSLEAVVCGIPGLKCVMPSTPADARGLLKSAIRDDDPVIFFEPKALYDVTGELGEKNETVPLGKADIKRSGSDITLICYGRMVRECLEAAESLLTRGVSAEVLDLRTLSPIDKESLLLSVSKTGRALIVHEAPVFGGFGGEVSSIINENIFKSLKAPVRRLGGAFCPVPAAPLMERNIFPDAKRIADEAMRLFLDTGE